MQWVIYICTQQTFERFSCRIHSQSRIASSSTGEIVICHPVSLEQQPWNALQNSFCKWLSPLGFKFFPSLVVDLMHEFELGVLKSILKHLFWIIHAIDPHKINILNKWWAWQPFSNSVYYQCTARFTQILLGTQERFLLRMLAWHGRTPFFLLLGRAMLTKRLTSSQ